LWRQENKSLESLDIYWGTFRSDASVAALAEAIKVNKLAFLLAIARCFLCSLSCDGDDYFQSFNRLITHSICLLAWMHDQFATERSPLTHWGLPIAQVNRSLLELILTRSELRTVAFQAIAEALKVRKHLSICSEFVQLPLLLLMAA